MVGSRSHAWEWAGRRAPSHSRTGVCGFQVLPLGVPRPMGETGPHFRGTLHADEGHRAFPRFPGESLTLVRCGTSESGAGLGGPSKCGLQKQGE